MTQELTFVDIDGAYGGDQHWMTHPRQNRGGCSTVCACEISILLANKYSGLQKLYRPDSLRTPKADFMRYVEEVFDYIYPHEHGLDTLELFVKSYEDFAKTKNTKVSYHTLDGAAAYEKAEAFVKAAIDNGLPLAYLLLRHTDQRFLEYNWHWFTVTGYAQTASGLELIFGTWGTRRTLPFRDLWNTGHEQKGGMVVIAEPQFQLLQGDRYADEGTDARNDSAVADDLAAVEG